MSSRRYGALRSATAKAPRASGEEFCRAAWIAPMYSLLPGALSSKPRKFFDARQFDDAVPILERAKRYFADSNVLSVLGPCYLDAGEPLDAVLVYKELVKREIAPADENKVN